MNPDYRNQLLAIMSRTEQQIAETESLTVEVSDDEILMRASEQVAELRRVLAEVEGKLAAN